MYFSMPVIFRNNFVYQNILINIHNIILQITETEKNRLGLVITTKEVYLNTSFPSSFIANTSSSSSNIPAVATSLVSSASSDYRIPGLKSVVKLKTASRHDSTPFFCTASNAYGSDVQTILLLVKG